MNNTVNRKKYISVTVYLKVLKIVIIKKISGFKN